MEALQFDVFASFPARKERVWEQDCGCPNSVCGCAQTCPCLQKLLLCSFFSGTFQFGAGRHRGKVGESVLKTLHVAEPLLLLTQVLGLIVFESSQPWPCLHLEAM